MATEHKSQEDEEPVVIDGAFIRAAATNAMSQFFRPITVVFELMKPNKLVVHRLRPGIQDDQE